MYHTRWSYTIRARDNFTCQTCGRKHKSTPERRTAAHHIFPKAIFPHMRFLLENGITLCWRCHRKLIHITQDSWQMWVAMFSTMQIDPIRAMWNKRLSQPHPLALLKAMKLSAGTTCKDHNMPELSYIDHSDWCEEKSKTHKQLPCMECGLFKVWRKK